MSEENKRMDKIEQLEGEERIRALEKAIGRYEGREIALPFIEKAIEYYKGDPEAIPFVDQAIKRRKRSMGDMVIAAPILMVVGWVWSTYIVPWLRFPTTRMKTLFGFMILDAIGKVVFIIGLLLLVIGFPYYLYKFLGLKMLRRRLARLAG